ncbi:MAG: OmpH family outer membrane protein [Planctomycetota bacterium]
MRTVKCLVGGMAVGALVVMGFLHGSAVGKTESSTPLKIGVVNLEKVMTIYPPKVKLEKVWQEQKEKSQAELQALADELEALAKEIEALDRKSDEAKEKRLAMAEKQAKLQVRKAVAEQELVQRYKASIEVIYNEVLGDVEEFRRKMGYDLIIQFSGDPMASPSFEQLQMQMIRKIVLASNSSLDMTDKMIEFVKGQDKQTEKP